MATIKQDDLIQSVADALQYISFYHPVDYITNLARAYEMEQSAAAQDAMAQILINSRMCAEGHRPICQDTGIVTAFVKVGMEVVWEASKTFGMMTMQQMADEGVREAWRNADNVLRPSLLADPAFTRRNTGDNTPAMVVVELVPGWGRGRDGGLEGWGERGEVEVCDAESVGLGSGLGIEDGADDGSGVVSAGDVGDRDRGDGGEGDGDGERIANGPDRYAGADRAWSEDEYREAACGAVREGESAGHRGAGGLEG